jgi:hypothetical protein
LDEVRSFLDTKPICEGVAMQVTREEDAEEVIEIFKKYKNLRNIQGSVYLIKTPEDRNDIDIKKIGMMIAAGIAKHARGSAAGIGEFLVKNGKGGRGASRGVGSVIYEYLRPTPDEIYNQSIHQWVARHTE